MDSPLFTPLRAGELTWPNRMMMAPMTRGRAMPDGTPTPMMAEYYALRADAGLIVTEATSISQQGSGWLNAPGIYTAAHEKNWRVVTDAVHKRGGRIYLQLWHMGRVSHPDFQNGGLPVAPSAIAAEGNSRSTGKPYVTPHALTVSEIAAVVQDYARAARRAMNAGFDGVEIHSANGYLIDQFLRDGSNRRSDNYGGSIENRTRLLHEVVGAICKEIGAAKVGVRLSPRNPFNSMSDSDPLKLFSHAAGLLSSFGLAYLHVLEALSGRYGVDGERISPHMRRAFKGVFVVNGAYDQAKGEQAIKNGEADAVAYGEPFLANPDLVERFRRGLPLNKPDSSTYYTQGEKGYLDYPLSSEAA